MFLIVSTQSHTRTYIYTRAFTLTKNTHTHTIYEEVKQTMHIILIYEKTIRNQCVATKKKEGKWRNAGDFLGRQSLVAKEKLPLTQCQARNVRKRMSMMFLYILLLYSFACALKKKNPLNPIASSSIGACWFHEQLQAAAAAAGSSFPLFLRFTPLFFFLIKTKIL